MEVIVELICPGSVNEGLTVEVMFIVSVLVCSTSVEVETVNSSPLEPVIVNVARIGTLLTKVVNSAQVEG